MLHGRRGPAHLATQMRRPEGDAEDEPYAEQQQQVGSGKRPANLASRVGADIAAAP